MDEHKNQSNDQSSPTKVAIVGFVLFWIGFAYYTWLFIFTGGLGLVGSIFHTLTHIVIIALLAAIVFFYFLKKYKNVEITPAAPTVPTAPAVHTEVKKSQLDTFFWIAIIAYICTLFMLTAVLLENSVISLIWMYLISLIILFGFYATYTPFDHTVNKQKEENPNAPESMSGFTLFLTGMFLPNSIAAIIYYFVLNATPHSIASSLAYSIIVITLLCTIIIVTIRFRDYSASHLPAMDPALPTVKKAAVSLGIVFLFVFNIIFALIYALLAFMLADENYNPVD